LGGVDDAQVDLAGDCAEAEGVDECVLALEGCDEGVEGVVVDYFDLGAGVNFVRV
jgi:hypothetical protein